MVETSTNLATLKSSPYIELLGYKEPDGTVAVDVNTTINAWPEIVATGKRIGSPSSAAERLVEGNWFDEFMTGIAQKGSHVDFICLHYYSPDGDVSKFESYIEAAYAKYHLPIWVTEWSYINYSTDPPSLPSREAQVLYVQQAVGMMNGDSQVERYAWVGLPSQGMDLYIDGKATAM